MNAAEVFANKEATGDLFLMSMPTFPDATFIRDQALNLLLASIAYEELGLSHIINSEGEKIQRAVGTVPNQGALATSIQDLLDINASVLAMLEAIQETETTLMGKMSAVLAAADEEADPEPKQESVNTGA